MRKAKDPLVVDHPDHGCKLFPVCLDCPLPRCCMDPKPPRKLDTRLLQRAIEVDRLGKQGKTVRQIAACLNISPRTVRRARSLLKS